MCKPQMVRADVMEDALTDMRLEFERESERRDELVIELREAWEAVKQRAVWSESLNELVDGLESALRELEK